MQTTETKTRAGSCSDPTTSEEALLAIIGDAWAECDDYVGRFCEDVDDDEDDEEMIRAAGKPMALNRQDFAAFVGQKLLEWEDVTLWTEALDRGWVIFNAVRGVVDPAVVEARLKLAEALEKLESIRNRVQLEGGLN